ncbi:MAG: hypothetical protein PVF27_09105 [Gemmatimonadales bacterium]|jgi:tetratricopeptide (TPR) repeat protein
MRWLPCVLVLAACVGAAAEHDALGDRAYAEGRWADALVEYRLALQSRAPNAELRAKAAAAALHAGQLGAAAEEFVALADEGGDDRAGEAADGLVRVANRAIDEGDREALQRALDGLQTVAPGRALGTYAQQLASVVGTMQPSREALNVLTYAAASAPDAGTQDSLVYAYGLMLRRMGRCETAIDVFESLLRRRRLGAQLGQAERGLVLCALGLGRRAHDRNQPTVAERWFRLAATRGGTSAGGRLAYIGLGDVLFGLGDVSGAVRAYEQARTGLVPGDSVYAVVAERLNRLGDAERVFR